MRTVLIIAAAGATTSLFAGAGWLTNKNLDAQAEQTQAVLDAQIEQSRTSFENEVAQLRTAKSAADAKFDALTSSFESLSTERDALQAQLTAAQAETETAKAQALEKFALEADAQRDALEEKIGLQQALIAEKDTELDGLLSRVIALTDEMTQLEAEIASAPSEDASVVAAELEAQAKDALAQLETQAEEAAAMKVKLDAEISALTAELTARDETIATLQAEQAQLAAFQAEQAEALEVAATDVADAPSEETQERIAELTATLAERDASITALSQELEALATTSQDSEALAKASGEQDAQIAALDGQVAELTQVVAEQSELIANLRLGFGETPTSPQELAQTCVERANSILEGSQISFRTGTTAIDDGSVGTLERIRDLVIGCNNENVVVEIGGHTDSLGADSANQALSEARADAVKEFLVSRGISIESLLSVGFGESQPIATNDTNEGRAANRRITFTWQVRDDVDATAEADAALDAVDG